MKFKEDYTQEERQIAHDKQVNSKRKKRNMYYLTDYTDKMKQNVMQWQKDHREQYRVYNRELKKRRYVERGKPKLSDKALNKRMRKVAIQNTRHFRTRGHITKQQYKEILMEIEKRKVADYLDKVEGNVKKKIILCIIGESGAGKTLVSLHLKYKLDANVICSFTTRPPRETEVEGRDHHFVDIVPDKNDLLAYCVFGGYKYYALKTQVYGPVTVYVIDENGYLDLKERFKDEYDLHAIYVSRKKSLKMIAGVPEHRMARDKKRAELLSDDVYDCKIENNGTKAEFFEKVETIYNNLLEKAKEYGW